MSLTCIPHTVHSIKPRSAFRKAPVVYAGAHHYISWTLFPLSASSVSLCRRCYFVPWDPERQEMGENEVKSLLFIIVVIVYLQYLEERSGKKKKRSFFATHYSLALCKQNRFSFRPLAIISEKYSLMCEFRSRESSSPYARAIGGNQRRRSTPKAGKTPRPAALFQASVTGGLGLQILHPKMTILHKLSFQKR